LFWGFSFLKKQLDAFRETRQQQERNELE